MVLVVINHEVFCRKGKCFTILGKPLFKFQGVSIQY